MLRSFGRTSNITLVSECSDGCPLPQWAQSHNVDEAGRRPSSALLRSVQTGERHGISAVAFVVAEGGFEPPTFGLCDLTHLSMRVGLYLHTPWGACHPVSTPSPIPGLGPVLLDRSWDVGSTDFEE
jgi:hypothetical protein